MATKGTFQSRLDEVFGALSSTAPSSGGAPAWSVSSSQVERRQWRKFEEDSDDDDEVGPTPEGRPQEQEEDDEEEEGNGVRAKRNRRDYDGGDDELMDVENMVGMDPALDSEDEEDQYDQVAMCKKSSDKLYMKEFNEDTDYFDKLPSNLGELKRMPRDVRASREGAVNRLAEDAKEAEMSGTAQFFKTKRDLHPSVGSENNTLSFKPEGKRKDNQTVSAAEEKRVRFADGTKAAALTKPVEARPASAEGDRYKNVPDHVRHPEKYTYYYLDWSEEDGGTKSNDAGFRETMEAVKRDAEAAPPELPRSVPFVPRKTSSRRPEETEAVAKCPASQAGVASMAAADDEVRVVDDSCVTPRTASRTYRARNRPKEDDE